MGGTVDQPYRSARWLLLYVSLLTHSALAETLVGKVVRIADGDTLTILAGKRQHKIRLDGIDAPERGQPFYKRSRQSLAQLCAGKQAKVEYRGDDRYGRIIGRVECGGIDTGSEQVRRGMAWTFKRYVPLGSPLYEMEAYARLREVGLWSNPQPVAPWKWRAKKRQRAVTQ